jgi:hypothetical protein
MKTSRRTWYITLTAIYYLLICSATSLFYLTQHLLPNPSIIPWGIQFLCLATALSSALYFANPRLGHRCLIVTTVPSANPTFTPPAFTSRSSRSCCFPSF